MKKSFITIGLITLSLGAKIQAQETVAVVAEKPSFHRAELGVRFMPTFSSFSMQTSSGGTIKSEVTLGYGVGALLGFNFSNHVGIQGEVIYNSLSQKYKDQNLQREINVRYVNIPLLLAFNTNKSNPVNLNIVFGPQLGFNVGSSIKSSTGSSIDTLTTVLAIKKGDLGFAYGAGLEFSLNSSHTVCLDLGFRGVFGFINISNTSQATATDSYYILDRTTVKTYSGYVGIKLMF